MSQSFSPWSSNFRLFSTFFQENPTALKLFFQALLALPDNRMLSCILRSSAFPARCYPAFTTCMSSFSTSVYLADSPVFHLDIQPLFSGYAFSEHLPSPHSESAHVISLLPTSEPLLPHTPFLRIFLIFPSFTPADRTALPFYFESIPSSALDTVRFLNLQVLTTSSFPPCPNTLLLDVSRFLLIRNTRELTEFQNAVPTLRPLTARLGEYLREREISDLFCEKTGYSNLHPEGIQAMCSLNRLLLKENRISDLREASENPAVLARYFREYQQKGLL